MRNGIPLRSSQKIWICMPNQLNIFRLYAVLTQDKGDQISPHFHLSCCSKETLEPFFQCGMTHKNWVIMSFHIFLPLAAQSRLSKLSSNAACPMRMWRIIAFFGNYPSQSLFSHLVCELIVMLVCAAIIGFNIPVNVKSTEPSFFINFSVSFTCLFSNQKCNFVFHLH